jgi:archaemetzincin
LRPGNDFGSKPIALIPVGSVSQDLLVRLQDRMPKTIGRTAVIGETILVPPRACNPRRHQCLGDAILEALRPLRYPEAERLVGLIDRDCYAPGLNFIFGQAAANGREAMVALPRLRPLFYGLPEDPDLFRERVLKEVVHELGHTWALGHCLDTRCVMHFSNRLADTDFKHIGFCPRCARQLEQAGC